MPQIFLLFLPVNPLKMRIPSNRLKSILKFAKTELSAFYNEQEIKSFFFILCDHYLKMDKTAVVLNMDYALSESELLKFNFAIKDLKTEKPIQYIIGETEFFGLNIKVNKHTLIPRPETEELVKLVIDNELANYPLRILDIGTGSGCIAISLAKHLNQASVMGVDISTDAIKIAKLNCENSDISVTFEVLDILNVPKTFNYKFNVIISNPPYVLEKEKSLMKKNVLEFEPHQALFVKDDDSLLFYKKILDFAQEHLAENGKIYFEINEMMGVKLTALLKQFNYHQIELRNDLSESPRMIFATKR